MRDMSLNQLKTLYFNFTRYRDEYCNGMALMSVQEFHKKHGLGAYVPA